MEIFHGGLCIFLYMLLLTKRELINAILSQMLYIASDHAGIIRTALANMDREAREHYTVVIQAKDMAGQVGGLSGSTTINITLTDINDNPPKFPQSTYTTLPENDSPVNKTQAKVHCTYYKYLYYT